MTPEQQEVRTRDWYDRLAAVALGRLYWSEDELLHSDVNAVMIGYAEHKAMLRDIFGSAPAPPPGAGSAPGKPTKLTPKTFDALLGGGAPTKRRLN